MAKQLNDKERVFVGEYLIDHDPAKAALKAGYSATMARTKAFQWVSDSKLNPKPYIRAAIEKATKDREARLGATADRIYEELSRIGLSNVKDFVKFDADGIVKIKGSEELTPEQAACIAEVVQNEGEKNSNFKFKLHDKLKALELMGKHKKMFTDKVEHSGNFTVVMRDYSKEGKQNG